MAIIQSCLILFVISSSTNADQNLALHRPAYQSSTFEWYGASYAVDGIYNNNWNNNPSCAHNGDGSANWLVVDLGRKYYVQSVVLTGRRGCDTCINRLDYFIVGVTNLFNESTYRPIRNTYPLCGQYPTTASATEKMYLNCSSNTLPGRFVIIQQPPNGPGSLTICELEVYGYASTDENLASSRPAYQSSTFIEGGFSLSAGLAVDGNADSNFTHHHCSSTSDKISDTDQWFVVDLGRVYRIQSVILTKRTDNCCDNFIVGITNDFSADNKFVSRNNYSICGTLDSQNAIPMDQLTVQCDPNTLAGRYVIIQQPVDGSGFLTICELEIYVDGYMKSQYIGCYRNISTTDVALNSSTMTIERCTMICRQRNKTFAALRDSDDCLCTDEVHNSTSDNECQSMCSGNQYQYCGGTQNYAVYSVCPVGIYGSTCSSYCHCRNSDVCNVLTGICPDGCDDNWTGMQCNQINSVFSTQYIGCYVDTSNRDFSSRQSTTDRTLDNSISTCYELGYPYAGAQNSRELYCGNTYGRYGLAPSDSECYYTCTDSKKCGGPWRNSVYSVACPNGTYGMGCSKDCHCVNRSSCYSDGRCILGRCETGWKGNQCNIRDCSVNNGSCRENEICEETELLFSSVTRCECASGYQRINYWNRCSDIDECSIQTSCNTASETCVNTNGSFHCVCHQGYNSVDPGKPYTCKDIDECKNTSVCDATSEICNNTNGSYYCECRTGFNSTGNGKSYHCEDIDECLSNYGGCENETTSCNNTIGSHLCDCRSGYNARVNDSMCMTVQRVVTPSNVVELIPPTNGGKIAGAVIGSLILVALIVVVIILFVMWRRKKNDRDGDFKETTVPVEPEIPFVALTTTCIPVEHLKSYARENQNEIEKQYQEIPTQTEDPCTCGSAAELKPKNRFKNVIPYDSNCVLLQTIEGQEFSHYINASYITNYNSTFTDVIAAQGPNDHTVPDFWRMVCEQNVSVIVMITDLYENGKQKCSRYWPESKQESFGNITVTLTEVRTWPRFVIRHLKVETENVDKEVIQLQYLKWPDHGVPDNVGSFLNFRRKARASMSPDTRTVVHCSAGIGRTGVFIAVDYLLEQAKAEKCVDVKECLKTLRNQRPQMIQTLTQYKFVYTALVTDLSLGDTTIPLDDNFRDKVAELQAPPKSGMCQLKRQFEILTEGSRDRTVSLADKFMVTLSKSEIDAVYLSNFQRPDAFVVGQMPPNINLEDFLKLCTNDSKFLVYVDDLPEERLSFLPSVGNATHNLKSSKVSICEKRKDEFGTPYSIKVEKDEEDLYANAVESETNIYANSSSQTSDLTLLHVTTIQKNTIGCDAVTSVSKRIETVLNDENYKGIPVLSRSGHDLAAFLVAGNNILEMARLHNEVDLFQIVYEMKRVQPTFIPTYESYKDLHDFVLEYQSGASYDTINQKAYHSGLGHRSIFPGQGEEMYANVQTNGINLC